MKITLIALAFAAALSLPAAPASAFRQNPTAGTAARATTSASPVATPTPAPTFSIKPTTISTGRTRDVTISVENGSLADYKLKPPAPSSGVTYEPAEGRVTNGGKSLMFRVSVDEDAELGPITVEVAKGGDAPDARTFELEITEFRARRITRGPTPDDIIEVDRMWTVQNVQGD